MSDFWPRGSVAILGCGWLGEALAQSLLADGYRVFGSTTNAARQAELAALGIEARVIRLPLAAGLDQNPATILEESVATRLNEDFWSADQLVLSFPPGRSAASAKTYPGAVLSAVLAYRRAQASGRIMLCSSTGIYGDTQGQVDVRTPLTDPSPRVQALALAEAQVRVQSQRPHVILRLGGLYGGSRHPGYHLAGRQVLPEGDAPINLVSRDRVISELRHWLDAPFWTGEVHNVVDPEHPSRRDYYTAFAKTHGLEPPTFLDGGSDGKVVV